MGEPDDDLTVSGTVVVTADRRADEQARLLERFGLRVRLAPVLGTVLETDDGPLRAVTDELIARPPEILIANTGIGVRTWLAAAATWGSEAALLEALGSATILARGPKAVGALRRAGLEVAWRAPSEQLREVLSHVEALGVRGRRVAVQRHGEDWDVADTLRAAGAEVVEVPVYRWVVPAELQPARDAIGAVCDGLVDAVTFTSAPAARHFVELAESLGVTEELLAAFDGPVLAACVGPVCAAAAAEVGIGRTVVPEHWRLGSLVRLVAEELARRAHVGGPA